MGHPVGDKLKTIIKFNLMVKSVDSFTLSNDVEIPAKTGMKWIKNGDLARIAGISLCRVKAVLLAKLLAAKILLMKLF